VNGIGTWEQLFARRSREFSTVTLLQINPNCRVHARSYNRLFEALVGLQAEGRRISYMRRNQVSFSFSKFNFLGNFK